MDDSLTKWSEVKAASSGCAPLHSDQEAPSGGGDWVSRGRSSSDIAEEQAAEAEWEEIKKKELRLKLKHLLWRSNVYSSKKK